MVCRTAIVLGTAIPLVLFLVWNAVILGTITIPEMGSNMIVDPLQQLRSTNGVIGVSNSFFTMIYINLVIQIELSFELVLLGIAVWDYKDFKVEL